MTDTVSFTKDGVPVVNDKPGIFKGTIGTDHKTSVYDVGGFEIYMGDVNDGKIQISFIDGNANKTHHLLMGQEAYSNLDKFAKLKNNATVVISAWNPSHRFDLTLSDQLTSSMRRGDQHVSSDLEFKIVPEANVVFQASKLDLVLQVDRQSIALDKFKAQQGEYDPRKLVQAQNETESAIARVIRLKDAVREHSQDIAQAVKGFAGMPNQQASVEPDRAAAGRGNQQGWRL